MMKALIELLWAVFKLCFTFLAIGIIILIPIAMFLVAVYSLLYLIITYVPWVLIVGVIFFGIILAAIFAN